MQRPILAQAKIKSSDAEYTVTLHGAAPGKKRHDVTLEKTGGPLSWVDRLDWRLYFMSERPAWAEFHAQINACVQQREKRGEAVEVSHVMGPAKQDNDEDNL